jgi:Zn-dependent metalloprotease
MKNLHLILSMTFLSATSFLFAQTSGTSGMQEFHGTEAAAICKGSKTVYINKQSRVPSFIVFQEGVNIPATNIFDALREPLKVQFADGWKLRHAEKDNLGFTHYRYDQTYNNIKVESGEYLVHERNGRVESVNGMWLDGITLNTTPSVSEQDALQNAMIFSGGVIFKWQVPEEEAQIKLIKNDPNATWFPKGELVIVCANNDIFKKDLHLAWKFDVFSLQPFARKYIYVDAQTGKVVASSDRIEDVDVPATGTTMYSGTQSFTCDNFGAGQYRLRETARGLGIQTFNCHNTTNQGGATDFTNASATWTNTSNGDNAAYDAHWGAEKTYDYYNLYHNRNGLDNAGLLMISYVHYDSGLDNAYWDGASMNYGDGNTLFNPLVSIDVCGHEFSHGVTQFTCNLNYSYESGAMNESYSDIMGTAIEFYAKPQTANFLIGEEITQQVGTALRDMQNPNTYGDPDTYMGTNWYSGTGDNGGVHTNSGVRNHWFYIECMGEAGTNDIGNSYNVTGLGVTTAADICYRGHTVYLVSTSQYADCRLGDIQAAVDLFGSCSPEEITTTNAWYACGVGAAYVPSAVNASFTADVTTSCSVPVTVNFTNTSTGANNAVWNFGDATTSTAFSPSHTYMNPGLYNVSLSVNSSCGADSVLQSSYININPPVAPTSTDVNSCSPSSFTLTASGSGTLNWFNTPTGGSPIATGTTYTTPLLNSTTTYYVDNEVAQPPGNVGPPSYNFGTGSFHNNSSTQYEIFTVYQNCTLATIDVNAGSSGNKTFTLWDGNGVQLSQYVVNVPSTGVHTLNINIPLTPGTYRLGGTMMNLYRNNSGPSYPYSLAGVIDITGSSNGSGFYYYAYNWGITLQPCTSARTPVVCSIGNTSVTFSTAAYDTVCTNLNAFTLTGGSPAGGTYSGPGVTGGVFDPAAAGQGLQTITYSQTDINGCTGTSTATIWVDVCTGINPADATMEISVYPNPANEFLTVELQLNSAQVVEMNLVNLLGETVYASKTNQPPGKPRVNINTASFAKGIYLLQVKTESGIQTNRVELQ